MGRASATKLRRLLWNTNLVEIELSSLCLPWSLYWVPLLQCWYSVHQKLLQLLYGEMSWKEISSLLLWPSQWMKHTVFQNGEFIARYCYPMIMTYMLLLHCLHPYLLLLSFCLYSYYVIINYIATSNNTKIQYILPSLIAVSKFMTTVWWELYQWLIMQRVSNARLHWNSDFNRLKRSFHILLCVFFKNIM